MEQRIQDGENPWAKLLLPAIGGIISRGQETQVRWAMLLAAVDIAAHGPEQLRQHKDPAGDRPFQLQQQANGFRLTSRLIVNDQPVTLIIGPTSESQ
jgi:hypothetical protein